MAAERTAPAGAPSSAAAAVRVCTRCNAVALPVERRPGSDGVERTLWLLGLLPGVLYRAWRNAHAVDVCGTCGTAEIVAPGTLRARKSLLTDHDEMVRDAAGAAAARLAEREAEARQRRRRDLRLAVPVLLAEAAVLAVVVDWAVATLRRGDPLLVPDSWIAGQDDPELDALLRSAEKAAARADARRREVEAQQAVAAPPPLQVYEQVTPRKPDVARERPSPTADPILAVSPGDVFFVAEIQGAWIRLGDTPQNVPAWMPSDLLERHVPER